MKELNNYKADVPAFTSGVNRVFLDLVGTWLPPNCQSNNTFVCVGLCAAFLHPRTAKKTAIPALRISMQTAVAAPILSECGDEITGIDCAIRESITLVGLKQKVSSGEKWIC